MKRTRSCWRGIIAKCVVAILLPAAIASAQLTNTKKVKFKTPKTKIDSFQGQVVSFTPAAVTVRDHLDTTKVRTFDYTPELTHKLENSYIEPGTKITVKYRHLSDTAVALKAKIT